MFPEIGGQIEEPQHVDDKELYSLDDVKQLTSISKQSVNFLESPSSDFDKNINIIFKCKDNCKTIFTNKHVLEMLRFTAEATNDTLWSDMCLRES